MRLKEAKGQSQTITMQDVAKYAGVSKSTVSHVINGTAPISDITRKQVLETIEKLKYKPNALARGLRMKKTKKVGLIIPDVGNEVYSTFARGVMNFAYERGYSIMICSNQYSLEREKMEVNSLIESRVDGLIFVGGISDKEFILEMKSTGIPIVLADSRILNSGIFSVEFDNVLALNRIVRHLSERGYRRIGYITESITAINMEDRFLGYRNSLKEYGVPYDELLVFIEKDLQLRKLENSYIKMKEILAGDAGNKLPLAFITTSDLIAIGVINAIKESGLRIPDDVAVTGFDDISISSKIDPPLTTIAQDMDYMGQLSAELILKAIEIQETIPQHIKLEPRLIVRKSS